MCDAARKVIVNGVQLIIVINLMCKMYNYIFHKGNESPLLFIYSNSCETHFKKSINAVQNFRFRPLLFY